MRINLWLKSGVCALLLLCSAGAYADFTLGEYATARRAPGGSRDLGIYIAGSAHALQGMNGVMKHQGQRQLYCEPANLVLNPNNYQEVMENYLTRNPQVASNPSYSVALVMLIAMMDAFPCR